MSQQQAVKMSAAPEAAEPAPGMLEGRQRKLESLIRDPRSPVNVESLLNSRAVTASLSMDTRAPGQTYKGNFHSEKPTWSRFN